ncbi:MAG: PAS domain S-box protein [Flavobacteriales bacterium]|nr:PAS domain S-box protein [Flavobacteriales bacterium]
MQKERIKVLYVDDEEGNLRSFKANFRRDFDVHIASSAKEALEVLAKEHMHVVISDQRMPGENGAELLAQVKELHPSAIRMLLTGYADIQAVIDAVNKGRIYAYTTKPWDPSDLKLRIQQAYEVYRLRNEKDQLLRRYQQVFAASGDPIVIVDENGTIAELNPALEQLIGSDRATLIRGGLTSLITDMEDLRKALRGRRKGKSFQNVDLTLNTPDGRTIDCLLTVSLLGNNSEGKRLYQAIIKDITDRKQEEERLRKLNYDLDRRVSVRTKQLLEALEDLGSFSYTVAHDLRSPLKNILALSDLQLEQLSGKVEEQDLAERIHRGAERMIQLVDDLLRFAQTNTRELQREEVDMHVLVEQLVHELPSAGHAPTIVNSVPPGSLVKVDRAMMSVLLQNLISNAVKFTRSVTAPRVEIGLDTEPEGHQLWVKDNGVGFDGSGSKLVFAAFKRMHRADQFEGNGVGLAIVQRIVNKHGGEVWAESRPGHGTTIHVRIPTGAAIEQALPFAS